MKQAAYIDDRRGPLLLAGMVVSALSAIFLVSCVDLLDAYEASRHPAGPGNGLDGGVWSGLAALANHSSSLVMPHNVLPAALNVPLVLAGAGGSD